MACTISNMFATSGQRVIGSAFSGALLTAARAAATITARIRSGGVQALQGAVKPMWIIVREVRERRRHRERVHRRVRSLSRLPIPPPVEEITVEEVISGPIAESERKRSISEDADDSMKSFKRRRYNFQPPQEWANTEWYQEHMKGFAAQQAPRTLTQQYLAQNLAKLEVEEEQQFPTPSQSLRSVRSPSPVPPKSQAGKYRYVPYSKDQRASGRNVRETPSLIRSHPPAYPFFLLGEHSADFSQLFSSMHSSSFDDSSILQDSTSAKETPVVGKLIATHDQSVVEQSVPHQHSIAQAQPSAPQHSVVQEQSVAQESVTPNAPVARISLVSKSPQINDVSMHDVSSYMEQTPITKVPTPPPSNSSDDEPAQQPLSPTSKINLEIKTKGWRRYLRDNKRYTNPDGYQEPIDKYFSPQARTFNAEHRIRLLREAAAQGLSPSQVPQPPPESPSAQNEVIDRDSWLEEISIDPIPSSPLPPGSPIELATPRPVSTEHRSPDRMSVEPQTADGNTQSFVSSLFDKIKLPLQWMSPSKRLLYATRQEVAGHDTRRSHQTTRRSRISEMSIDELQQEPEDEEAAQDEQDALTLPTPDASKSRISLTGIAMSSPEARKEAKKVTVEADVEEHRMGQREPFTRNDTPSPDPREQKESVVSTTPPITPKQTGKTAVLPKTPVDQILPQMESMTIRPIKSGLFDTRKTERVTRHQKKIDDLEAAKDAYKLVKLSKEWTNKVADAVRNGTSKYSTHDLQKVAPEFASGNPSNWLNDAVINDYISLVVKHGNQADRPGQTPTYAALSSFAFPKIAQDPTSLPTKWAKRQGIQGKKILDCQKIFFPCNPGNHWFLCVAEPQEKRVTVFNSMGTTGSRGVAGQILSYLAHEAGTSLKPSEWTVVDEGVSPQQRNCDDCGVFTITTARQIMLGKMEKEPYTADIIPVQRQRIVAELANGGLLTAAES